MIESDHKSLEQISIKNLADAPMHLQRMLFWLQDYDFTIKYHKGEEMVVEDTLLRYSPKDTPEILLDISVNHVYIDAEKKWDYQLIIKKDPLLSALTDMCDRLKVPGRTHYSYIKVISLLTHSNSSYHFKLIFYEDNLSYWSLITHPIPLFDSFGSKLWETAHACSRLLSYILAVCAHAPLLHHQLKHYKRTSVFKSACIDILDRAWSTGTLCFLPQVRTQPLFIL